MMRGNHARCGANHFRCGANALDMPIAWRAKPGMKNLLKAGLLLSWAMAATVALLALVLCAVPGMDVNAELQKMNSEPVLYIFPAFILFEFYFFINDLLAYFSKKDRPLLGFVFSEIRFTYDLDNGNAPIPSRAKLLQLYPMSISLTLLGLVLVFITR
jgi:hypothetical protein